MGLLDDAIREHLDLKRRRGGDPAEIERAEQDALGPVRRDPIASETPFVAGIELEPPHEPHDDWDEPTPIERPIVDAPAAEPDERPSAGRGFFRRRRHITPEPEPEAVPEPPLAHDDLEPWEEEDDLYADQYEHEEDEFEIEPVPDTPQAPLARPLASEPAPPAPAGPPPIAATPSPPAQAPPPTPAEPPTTVQPPVPEPPRRPAGEAPPSGSVPPARPAPRDELLGETAEYDVESTFKEPEPEGEDVLEETPEFLQDTPDHDRLWFEQRPPRDFDFDG
jgi:hypothetical protein